VAILTPAQEHFLAVKRFQTFIVTGMDAPNKTDGFYYSLRSVEDNTVSTFPALHFAMNFVLAAEEYTRSKTGEQRHEEGAAKEQEAQSNTEETTNTQDAVSSTTSAEVQAATQEKGQKDTPNYKVKANDLNTLAAPSSGSVAYTSNWYNDNDVDAVLARIRDIADKEGLETALYRALYSPKFFANDEKETPEVQTLADTKNHTRKEQWSEWSDMTSMEVYEGLTVSVPFLLGKFRFAYKENGKSVIVRIHFTDGPYVYAHRKVIRSFHGKATCSPLDDFDVQTGKTIAFRRAMIKMLEYFDTTNK
jgi:hypothetical protein